MHDLLQEYITYYRSTVYNLYNLLQEYIQALNKRAQALQKPWKDHWRVFAYLWSVGIMPCTHSRVDVCSHPQNEHTLILCAVSVCAHKAGGHGRLIWARAQMSARHALAFVALPCCSPTLDQTPTLPIRAWAGKAAGVVMMDVGVVIVVMMDTGVEVMMDIERLGIWNRHRYYWRGPAH